MNVATPTYDTSSITVRAWLMLALVMAVVAFGHFNRVAISSAGNGAIIDKEDSANEDHTSHTNINETQMGHIYSAFLILYTLFMIPGGWLIDRVGPKWALVVVCVGSAVFTILTGIVGLIWLVAPPLWYGLFVVRSTMGITNSPLHPASARMIASWFPPASRAFANGMVTFAACIGMAIVYVAFGKIMDIVGWPRAFLITGGCTIVLAIVWTTMSENGPLPVVAADSETKQSEDAPQDGPSLMSASLLALTASYCAIGYFQYLFFYWMERYFKEILEYSTDVSRWLSTSMVMAMGIGMVVGGHLADRFVRSDTSFGHRIVPMGALFVSAVAVFAAVICPVPVLQILLFLAAMVGVGACEGPCWTMGVRIGRKLGGTSAAIMNAGGNLGGLTAPILTPYIGQWFGWKVGLGVSSIACILGAIPWMLIQANPEKDSK